MSLDPQRLITEHSRAEQLRILMRQLPTGIVTNLFAATVTAFLLVPSVPPASLAIWLALFVLSLTGRAVLWNKFRSAADTLPLTTWFKLNCTGAGLTGILWGVGAIMLFPDDTIGRTLWICVITGLSAGAVGVNGAHLQSMAAFIIPANLLMAARLMAEGSALYAGIGGMSIVLAITLTLTGRHLVRAIRKTLTLRFELAERSKALAETNAQLLAEIAEHRSTEAALRQAQKLEAIGQLTGNIAHDFNNLLTATIGNLEMAITLTPETIEAARWQQNALTAARRGASLTQRLLAFARKQDSDPKICDLCFLINDSADLLKPVVGGLIRLELQVADQPIRAKIDSTQLELVILNLAINARDAMPNGGRLTIAIDRRHGPPPLAGGNQHRRSAGNARIGDHAVISVTDTGSGMPPAVLERAFEPFFTTKAVGAGSGLGLAIVHSFIVQSKGHVQITSEAGAGTAIEIWLPCTAPDLPPPGQPDTPRPAALASD